MPVTFSSGGPCPDRPLHTRPTIFHFTPGLAEHLSWVEALLPESNATDVVVCLDGELFGEPGIPVQRDGRVVEYVRTSWVDIQWLLGSLDLCRNPARWDLGYST